MVFGHNSNVKMGTHTLHVQTEDRGANHALIDTTVYFQGRVLHRRTNNYLDLLPLTEDSEQALKMRVDEQHRAVLEAIRNGELQLHVSGAEASVAPAAHAAHPAAVPARKWNIALLNAGSWLTGKQATLHVAVEEEGGGPVREARVSAEIEGSERPSVHSARTGDQGQATISFEMPKLVGGDGALVIRTEGPAGGAQLRFALRAKPRVPAAS
jgi:hypothetical protein